jgi:hypothetical protein
VSLLRFYVPIWGSREDLLMKRIVTVLGLLFSVVAWGQQTTPTQTTRGPAMQTSVPSNAGGNHAKHHHKKHHKKHKQA